jgi:hypothetical protein
VPFVDQADMLEGTPSPGWSGRFAHLANSAAWPASTFRVPEASDRARA